MRVKEVKDDMVTFICPKCGKEIKEKVNNEPKQVLFYCPKRAYDGKRCKEFIVDGLKAGGLYGRNKQRRS